MENYIVSARKYRPKTFKDVVGQEHITDTLARAIRNNHLAQAMLFCGPRGVGKTTCARIVARMINEVSGGDPSQDYSLNIFELDAASNNTVDEMRHLIEQVRYSPQVGDYKVYIIDEVHMLSTAAFNAFLKTLEEPPAHAIFILATTEKHKIIPTILSRCQIFDFKRIGVSDIASHLAYVAEQEGIRAEPDALNMIAQKGDGALRDSLSIFDRVASFSSNNITYEVVIENLNILDYDYYFKTIDLVLNKDSAGLFMLYDSILKKGFDGMLFIGGLSSHVRDLMMCKDPQTVELLEVGSNIKKRYLEQSKACHIRQIFFWLKKLNQCDIHYRNSNNKRLLVEITLTQLLGEPVAAEKKKADSIPVEHQVEPELRKAEPPAKETPVQPPEEKPAPEVEKAPEARLKEPAPNTAPASAKPISNVGTGKTITPKMPAFGKMMKKKKADSGKEEQKESLIKIPDSKAFTKEEFQMKWTEFAKDFKQDKPIFTILSKEPEFVNDEEILLHLESESQMAFFEEVKTRLMQFLRKELTNDRFTIRTEVIKDKKKYRPYTPEEKFNFMARKNPHLITLKQKLDMHL